MSVNGVQARLLVHVGPSIMQIMQIMHCAEAEESIIWRVQHVRNFWAMMKTRSQYSKMVVSLVREVGWPGVSEGGG